MDALVFLIAGIAFFFWLSSWVEKENDAQDQTRQRVEERRKKLAEEQQKAEEERRLAVQRKKEAAMQIRYLPVVQSPKLVVLKKGERCHLQLSAAVLVLKNEVVGHERSSDGMSVRVMKGVTMHSGSGRSTPIRAVVPHTYPGLLSITSARVIMTGEKGFDKALSRLSSMHYIDEYQRLEMQFGSTSYKLLLDNPFLVVKIVSMLQC